MHLLAQNSFNLVALRLNCLKNTTNYKFNNSLLIPLLHTDRAISCLFLYIQYRFMLLLKICCFSCICYRMRLIYKDVPNRIYLNYLNNCRHHDIGLKMKLKEFSFVLHVHQLCDEIPRHRCERRECRVDGCGLERLGRQHGSGERRWQMEQDQLRGERWHAASWKILEDTLDGRVKELNNRDFSDFSIGNLSTFQFFSQCCSFILFLLLFFSIYFYVYYFHSFKNVIDCNRQYYYINELENLTIIKVRIRVRVREQFFCLRKSEIKICFVKIFSRLCLEFNLGSKHHALNPMRQQSRDTSFSWLCGPKTVLITLIMTCIYYRFYSKVSYAYFQVRRTSFSRLFKLEKGTLTLLTQLNYLMI